MQLSFQNRPPNRGRVHTWLLMDGYQSLFSQATYETLEQASWVGRRWHKL